MITLCEIFFTVLRTIPYFHKSCVLLTVIEKAHQLLQLIWTVHCWWVHTVPALASNMQNEIILRIQIFWDVMMGYPVSHSWHVTFKTATACRASQTTHLRTQCHVLHNTAVIIWTPARKCHLATASLVLAIFFFSCLQLPPWWYGYVAGGVLQLHVKRPVEVVLLRFYSSSCLSVMQYWTFALGLTAWCTQHRTMLTIWPSSGSPTSPFGTPLIRLHISFLPQIWFT
jgi:hypothetical protein